MAKKTKTPASSAETALACRQNVADLKRQHRMAIAQQKEDCVQKAALSVDPNCPTETFWELLQENPLLAMTNPLFDLLTLAEPERWSEMERRWAFHWVTQLMYRNIRGMRGLLRQVMYACAEQAMTVFSKTYKGKTYTEALHCMKLWSQGRLSIANYERRTRRLRSLVYSVPDEFVKILKHPWNVQPHVAISKIRDMALYSDEKLPYEQDKIKETECLLWQWRTTVAIFAAAGEKEYQRSLNKGAMHHGRV